MYKEPLMLEKYEALQELYLKDPLRPLQVRSVYFVLCFIVLYCAVLYCIVLYCVIIILTLILCLTLYTMLSHVIDD